MRGWLGCAWVPLLLLWGGATAQLDDPPPVREEIERKIEVAWAWRLTDAVGLTPEQAEKVFPLLREFRDKRRELTKDKDDIILELSAYLDTGESQEARLEDALSELNRVHEELHGLEVEQIQQLRETLTTEQVARFVVFQEEFKRTIREIVEQRRKPPARPGLRDRLR
jgi:hypothetical protein